MVGLHGGAIVSTVTSLQKCSVFKSRLLLTLDNQLWGLCMESVSPCVPLLPPKDLHVRLIGDYNLAVVVNMTVLGCLSLCWYRL